MGLTDDPIYKYMTEGEDSQIIVGTVEMGPIEGPRKKFPVYIIDYSTTGRGMEGMVAQAFNNLQKIDLVVREGKYTLTVGKPVTTMMFAEGEIASNTAPEFWAEYTPGADEHKDFQTEYAKTGLWLFMVLTNETYRQFAIHPTGAVIHKLITPMTDQLRKSFKIGEEQ